MKREIRIIWIDDSAEREPAADTLREVLRENVEFRCVARKSIDDELANLMKEEPPTLIIMDHSLTDTVSNTFRTGSTAAAYIHEKWSQTPIISVTGVDLADFDGRKKEAYEAIFSFEKISNHYEEIQSIISGFHSLNQQLHLSLETIVNTLNASDQEKERIISILPNTFKDHSSNDPSITDFYRWFRSIFYSRPGFLYDKLWTATFLGLSEKGFEKVMHKFDRAKYNGIFANPKDPRWWKEKLLEEIAKLTESVGIPWYMGRKIPGVESEEDFSECFKSGEDYPETVAATDDTSTAIWMPMKLKYTNPHPNYERMLLFEDLRIMSNSKN